MATKKISEKVQVWFAAASFVSGVVIGSVCLFCIEPYGEIANSALAMVSELLIFTGALLGCDLYFDHKMQKFTSGLLGGDSMEEENKNR